MSIVKGRNPHKNAEGYSDPTAYEALRRISRKDGSDLDSVIIARRQREYPKGTKIRILEMHDPIKSKYNRKIGYVDFVDDTGYIFITFRGAKKGLRLSGLDKFEKL